MEHGWALPLTIYSILHIKDAGVFPLGVVEKFSINKKGYSHTKRHITHNCSFLGPLGLSLNNQVLRDTLNTCFYELFILRILHIISAMRIKWPSKLILIGKTDIDTEYRHIRTNA